MGRVFALASIVAVSVLSASPSAFAQSDVTAPGDLIVPLSGTTAGGSNLGPGTSPANELVLRAIDNTTQKYLNFGETGAAGLNTGFYVTPAAGPSILTGLRFFTANDAENRDPATYTLEGTLGDPATAPFTLISSGALALPTGRNPGGLPPTSIPIDAATQFNQTVTFANVIPYTSYRLLFPTVKGPGQNSQQIAEVEFLGRVIPEPATLSLLGFSAIGLLARRRARH